MYQLRLGASIHFLNERFDEKIDEAKALGFDSEGNKIQIPGGGICQISSTLYNAVLIAGLEVTERHPHSHRVYYVPQDKDATIFYGTYDLKFINNTDRDIKIETTNDNANVTITLTKI
jgi:vancomycin resistance protein YoaR